MKIKLFDICELPETEPAKLKGFRPDIFHIQNTDIGIDQRICDANKGLTIYYKN